MAEPKQKLIKYMKHPVSAEDKAKAVAEGFKIIDARFDLDREDATVSEELQGALDQIAEMEVEELKKHLGEANLSTKGGEDVLRKRLVKSTKTQFED